MSTAAAPAEIAAMLQRATLLHRQGQLEQALPLLQRALELEPAQPAVWHQQAYVLRSLGQHAAALEAFGEALRHGFSPAHEVHLERANLCADQLRRDQQARDELQAALALEPGYLPAWLNLGNWYEQHGQREQALEAYQRALALPDPQPPGLRWVALARSAVIRLPQSADDPQIGQLQEALSRVGDDPLVRPHLLFALGHGLDAVGRFDEAFEAYAKGNRSLQRSVGRRHDRRQVEALTGALIEAFPAAHSTGSGQAPSAGSDDERPRPLFICGMFRSGSTLVEQVLAAHPQVCAGGELDWLLRTAAQRLAPFPQSMRQIAPAQLQQLASEYRNHLLALYPQARELEYITDKRPDNFQLIGFIKGLFPTARIIHTTRQPLDNGLSVYLQNINLEVASYAGDLGDIGHYYGQYRRLMQHWRALYPESIHDFDYDAFVADPESQLRPLLAFLQLSWSEDCLKFHRLRNKVATASYWQVRKPLHDRSSGRWRHYADHLQPLLRSLREAGVPV